MNREAPLRDVSDTALWVAVYRARESERPDAVFRDPFARRLAGERGERIAAHMANEHLTWSMTARTHLLDGIIERHAAEGGDLVLNLAAGLDSRPYRLKLPASLRWVEADLPGMISYKEELLRGEKPVCRLERVALDLSDKALRRSFFAKLAGQAKRVLVITEGLLIYLAPEEVSALALDLSAAGFSRWAMDLNSPAIVNMAKKHMGEKLEAARAPFKFGPVEGPAYFEPRGWKLVSAVSQLKTARRLRRLSLLMWLVSWLPDPKGMKGKTPWSAICLFENSRAA